MANSLTTKQLAAISTGSLVPPWHLGQLPTIYKLNPLSLRSLLAKVGGKDTISYISVRDTSILKSAATFDALKAVWNTSQPTKATLIQLSNLLNSVGGRIVYISPNFQDVGVRGTFEALSAVHAIKVDSQTIDGVRDILTGGAVALGGVGTVLVTASSAAEGAEIGVAAVGAAAAFGAVVGGGVVIIGLGLIGLGIYELATSGGDLSLAPDIQTDAPTQYGPTPNGVDPANPPDAAVDVDALPDSPPPGCPPGPPVCPPGPPVCPPGCPPGP